MELHEASPRLGRVMGIGQEPSNSEVVNEEDTDNYKDDTQSEVSNERKTLSEAELELELAGKPWPVASHSFVINLSLCLLSICLILTNQF